MDRINELEAERDALRAELAALKVQTEQQPVAWTAKYQGAYIFEACLPDQDDDRATLDWKPLYATPIAQTPADGLMEALEHARLFIRNGVELGYIQMPDVDTPDPAHDTLPKIDAALAAHRAGGAV